MLMIKRVYDSFEVSDGYRVLVDRLWPRGVSKERAHLDEWLKTIAPSPDLRKWFNHQAEHFETFKKAYIEELLTDPEKIEAVDYLLKLLDSKSRVTLVYAAKDPQINHVVILKEFIEKQEHSEK